MIQDLRLAFRLLWKARGFTTSAVLTLAICIGANAAVFSIVRSVILRPLPVPDADRVMLVYNSYPNAGADHAGVGVPDYFDRRRGVAAFDRQGLFRRQGVTYDPAGGEAERLNAVVATPSFFRLVGAHARQGRLFRDEEGEPGHDQVALIGAGLWQSRFGGEPDVVGRTMRIDGTPHEIVGVLPAEFRLLWPHIDVWLPAAFTPAQRSDEARHSNNWSELGRLAPGATREQAQQQVDAINAANDTRFPRFHQILEDAGFHTVVVPLQEDVTRTIRPALYLLWGGVLFVLLIGCVNIANLMLVRTLGRARELATRHAVGATPWRLSRQLLTESLAVAAIGGTLGIALGFWALRAASGLHLADLPLGFEITMDGPAVLVMAGVVAIVGLVVGLLPVLRLRRLDVSTVLQEEGRSGTGGRSARLLRRSLATAEVAAACVLLTGAGLLAASFRQVLRQDPGFEPSGVMTAAVNLPGTSYRDNAAVVSFMNRLLDELRALPGVTAAGATDSIPRGDNHSNSVILPEDYQPTPGESLLSPSQIRVSDDYLEAMRTAVVEGRAFTSSDTADSPPVALVDERLARTFWPGRDPVGRRMRKPDNPDDLFAVSPETKYITVVGVVKNVALHGLEADEASVGAYYFPLAQQPTHTFVLAVRATTPVAGLVEPIRRAVAALDPSLPVFGAESMDQRMDDSLVGRRVPMQLALGFGAVALLLSALGVYSVLAYSVAQRRRELGIRLALGSTPGGIFGLILGDGLRLTIVGLVIGMGGALVVGRLMASQLFGVQPADPRVLTFAGAALAVVALLASVIPARRASRVSPREALN